MGRRTRFKRLAAGPSGRAPRDRDSTSNQPRSPLADPPAPSRPEQPLGLADITVVVTCFLRFDRLRDLLWSVRAHFPGLPVVVADNSVRDHYPPQAAALQQFPRVTWLQCPFDCGVTAARNAGFRAARTRLVLVCEEDFVFTAETDLAAMLDVLNASPLRICAGLVRVDGGPASNWSATITRDGTVSCMRPLDTPWERTPRGTWHRRTDSFVNFFLARRQDLVEVAPADERIKIVDEHIDWLFTFQSTGLSAAYTSQCIVDHMTTGRTKEYVTYRHRRARDYLFQKWGLTDHQSINTRLEPPLPPRRPVTPHLDTVLLTIGHTGSSITAGLLALLGWNLPDNDPQYNEPRRVRECNAALRSGASCDLETVLSELPRPWVLKDPRFCETLESWLPALVPYRPRLLWLERDFERVRDSYRRRGEDPAIADRRQQFAEQHYLNWPWQKARVRFEDLAAWAAAIETQRI